MSAHVSLTSNNSDYAWKEYANAAYSYTTNGLNQYSAAGAASYAY
ncbi:MAG: hypothetical protein AB7P23_10170 [Amphiplicatus sp.]